MKRNLSGMIIVITGASAGIGRALAEELHGRGAKLVLSARRLDKLNELNAQLDNQHLVIQADVSKTEDCQRLITQSLATLGRIDTLICNAGYGLVRRVAETSPSEMRDIFNTNVFGTSDCIHAAIPSICKQPLRDNWRGQIIIVASAVSRRSLPYFGAYAATKAAQLSLAEALRVELKHQQIGVTSIHPIGTRTDFFDTAERVSDSRIPKNSLEVQQTPQQVARKIIRSIEKPTTEVWPFPLARIGLSLSTFVPSLVDRVLTSRKPK